MSGVVSRLRKFASNGPVIFFIALTYAWTWGFWIPAHVFELGPQGLKLALTFSGGFGPAVAGLVLVNLQETARESGPRRWSGFLVGVALAVFGISLFRIMDGFGVDALAFPEDSPSYVYAVMALPVLLCGWVFSSIQSRNPRLRALLGSLVPDRWALMLAVPVVLFLPAIFLGSNLLADLLGMEYKAPMYTTLSMSAAMAFMFAKLFTAALLTGGNEEYGWRGVLLPILQKAANPLVATLVLGVVWELWHLPLTVGGVYGDGNPAVITLLRMTAVIPLALVLTALYNSTRGSIFLCVLLHGCYNSQTYLFFGSEIASILAPVLVIAILVYMRFWRADRAYDPLANRN